MKYRLVDGLLITMRYIDEVEYRLVGGLYNYNKLFQYKGYSTPACGSAHARNGRGCRQIEAVNATVLPRGALRKFHACARLSRKR